MSIVPRFRDESLTSLCFPKQFGGSTIALLFEPGRMVFDSDMASLSELRVETLLNMGNRIGVAQPLAP